MIEATKGGKGAWMRSGVSSYIQGRPRASRPHLVDDSLGTHLTTELWARGGSMSVHSDVSARGRSRRTLSSQIVFSSAPSGAAQSRTWRKARSTGVSGYGLSRSMEK